MKLKALTCFIQSRSMTLFRKSLALHTNSLFSYFIRILSNILINFINHFWILVSIFRSCNSSFQACWIMSNLNRLGCKSRNLLTFDLVSNVKAANTSKNLNKRNLVTICIRIRYLIHFLIFADMVNGETEIVYFTRGNFFF